MIKSILIYFIFFMIITFITYIAEKSYRKSKIFCSFLILVSIILLSVFAGMRSYNVGIDVQGYGLSTFHNIFYFDTLKDYLNFYKQEYLFYILNYFVYQFTTNYHYFLLLLQFISSYAVYKYAFNNIEKRSPTFFIFCFLLLWYCSSLNIIRQTTSIVLMLVSFDYLTHKKYFRFILMVIIATMFHTSSIFCIFYILLQKLSERKEALTETFLLGIFILFAFVFGKGLLRYFPFMPSKYLIYLGNNNYDISTIYLVVEIAFLILALLFKKYAIHKKENILLIEFIYMDLIFYLCGMSVEAMHRISYFFMVYKAILLPNFSRALKEAKVSGTGMYNFSAVVLLFVQWFVRYAIVHYDYIIPITFDL